MPTLDYYMHDVRLVHTDSINGHHAQLWEKTDGTEKRFWVLSGPHVSGMHIHDTLTEVAADIWATHPDIPVEG